MSKQTELVLQNAAKQVNAATVALQKVMTELAKNVELIDSQNQTIAMNESKIDELTAQYKEKAREADINFQLSLKENQKATVDKVLTEQGFTSIKSDELNFLRTELDKLKKSFEEEVKKAEDAAKNEANAKIESMKTLLELQKKAEMAEVNGKLASAMDKNSILESHLTSAREEIVAMRNAETERVKAMSGKDVIINAGMQQR